jgi:hypothetical protein
VDDSKAMSVFQGVADVGADGDDAAGIQRSLLAQSRRQRSTTAVLHDDEGAGKLLVGGAGGPGVEDRDDSRVREPCRRDRLLLEALNEVGPAREMGVQKLYRHRSGKHFIPRQPHCGHAPGSNPGLE